MESLDSARVKAPASLRTLNRAVTIRDYEDIGVLLNYVDSVQSVFYDIDSATGDIHIIDGNDTIVKRIEKSTASDIDVQNEKNLASGYTDTLKYSRNIRIWLMPVDVKIDPENPNIVEISDEFGSADLMNEIQRYYNEKRMIGQKIEINPANVKYIKPIVKIKRDKNYTEDTVKNALKSRLIELMKLGTYKLKEDLIWSDLIRNITDPINGVAGLRSALFVEVDETCKKYYVAEDIPSELGTVFALKPKDFPEDGDPYPYEIDIIME